MKKIKYLLINAWKLVNNFIYMFIKLFKTKHKITFISRQTNGNNIDFNLIVDEIKKQDSSIDVVILNKMIKKGLIEKIKYGLHIYMQMYHIATSKVIIIDGYCIPVCTLHHKKNLKVIQIWHALGSLKKFGYSILDKKEGSNKDIAKVMNMHKNYTYILTSSEYSKQFFKEAFHATEDQMKVIPLPKVDFLKSDKAKQEVSKKFYNNYTLLKNDNKKKILYVPTFRKNIDSNLEKVINSVNYEKFDLIIKTHDDSELVYYDKEKNLVKETNFSGFELLHIADFIITDYSAIVYEAALVNKPIYFYNYDYEDYINNRGFYIDYLAEMPGLISKDIYDIMNEIENNKYDFSKLKRFREKYIINIPNCTKEIVQLIMEGM